MSPFSRLELEIRFAILNPAFDSLSLWVKNAFTEGVNCGRCVVLETQASQAAEEDLDIETCGCVLEKKQQPENDLRDWQDKPKFLSGAGNRRGHSSTLLPCIVFVFDCLL